MKTKVILTLILFCLTIFMASAQQKQVEVTYVGNAGFLINTGEKKILIDALFKGFEGSYNLPQSIQEKLSLAQAPFDDVDLIIVTHAHGDHVNPVMVRQHMQNNPKAIFASTQQMVDALKGINDRCYGFNPSKEESDSKIINGIGIETFYLPHGTNSRVINIGFLITVNGITIFQTGDADFDQFTYNEFRSLQLPEKKIDLAFIQHYYMHGDSLSTKFVREAIGGNYIFPIHYHFTTPAFDSTIVRANFPDAIIFEEELQTWKMPLKAGKLSKLTGAYLGQPIPGDEPLVFAPGIISVDSTIEHGFPTFSPDGKEVFWQSNLRHKDKETEIFLNTMRCKDGQWTKAEPSPFGGMPAFSSDGKHLYFISFDEEEEKDLHIVEKQANTWSKPKCLNLVTRFPEIKYVYGPSLTNNGTLYFFGHAEGLGAMNNFGIYRSEIINGIYTKPELLPASINAANGVLNWTPYIAPDESYLLFSSNRINKQQDIYISFRRPDGTWTDAYSLGSTINTKRGERFPALSPDGKYLFFTRWVGRGNEDVLWMRSTIIDDLKAKYNITP